MNWLDRTVPERWQPAFLILVVLGMLAVFGLIAFEQMNESRAREEVLRALHDISPNAGITINGKAQPSTQVLEALRTLHHVDPHHSSQVLPIQVEIREGSKTIDLVVARDSERSEEYWVYKPGWNYHNNPLGEELGAIQTDVFKDY